LGGRGQTKQSRTGKCQGKTGKRKHNHEEKKKAPFHGGKSVKTQETWKRYSVVAGRRATI